MIPLSSADRTKLAKLLALLGSDQPGERDAAALAATRFIQARDITWPQVIRPVAQDKALPEMGTWRQTVAQCLEQRGSLRRWELTFLRDLPSFRRLSVKQRYLLKEIADRVLAGRSPG